LRFTLSYRDVEELLAERGLDISYETVRRWVLKFGPLIARRLRQRGGCRRQGLGQRPSVGLGEERCRYDAEEKEQADDLSPRDHSRRAGQSTGRDQRPNARAPARRVEAKRDGGAPHSRREQLPNPVIRSHYRNGFIRQYVRDHLNLRTEPATNNVTDYGVFDPRSRFSHWK
jgi:hypothetical protein